MSAPVSSIVQVSISQNTQAVQQQSFSIPAIFGTNDRFAPVSTTATTTSGSNQITVTSATGIGKGQRVSGTGIPAYTTVLSIVGTSVYLSANATATGSGVAVSFKDCIRAYTSLAGMVSDGYLTSDQEYIEAAELLEQDLQPTIFYVGHVSAAVAQVVTVSPDTSSQQVQHYIQTIQSVTYDYTSDSTPIASEVVAGLIALINADSNCPVTASGTSTLILTAKVAGTSFTYAETSNLTAVLTTGNHSFADDIAAAQAQPGGDSWYGCVICSQLASDIEQVAAYIETQLKVFGYDTVDAGVPTSATNDVASVLKGKAYNRTFGIYATTALDGRAAGLMGGQLPQVPGASTWKFQTIKGITPDSLTPTQRVDCKGVPGTPGKNINIYETVGGVNILEEGVMASGQFIDVTIGIDWLTSQMQTNVFSQMVNGTKIPYTNAGIAVIENAVRQTLMQGAANGLIDANSIVVTVPDVLSVPVNDRAERLLPAVTFTCRLAGALHFVQINGTVTV